jgi:hypothetical protein
MGYADADAVHHRHYPNFFSWSSRQLRHCGASSSLQTYLKRLRAIQHLEIGLDLDHQQQQQQ